MLCYIYIIMLCEDTIVQLIRKRYSLRSRIFTRFYRRDREYNSCNQRFSGAMMLKFQFGSQFVENQKVFSAFC